MQKPEAMLSNLLEIIIAFNISSFQVVKMRMKEMIAIAGVLFELHSLKSFYQGCDGSAR